MYKKTTTHLYDLHDKMKAHKIDLETIPLITVLVKILNCGTLFFHFNVRKAWVC